MDFVICYFKVVRLQFSLTAVVLGGASVRTFARVLWCTVFMCQLKVTLYVVSSRIYIQLSCNQTSASTDAQVGLVASGCHAREKIKLSIIKKKETSFEDNNIAECSRGHSPAGKMAKGGLHCWDSIGQEGDVFLYSVRCLYRL